MLEESGKLLVRPYIEELPELFVSYFKEILRVGYGIPRLEYYMSNGMSLVEATHHITGLYYLNVACHKSGFLLDLVAFV